MSPALIVPLMAAAGIAALLVLAPMATKAAERGARPWAIERCDAERCDLLPARYSGPTACNLDAASERIGRQMPSGTRLVCVREPKGAK